MKRILTWLVVAIALLIGLLVYRSRQQERNLNVSPDAGREIEKAKRR